MHGVFCLRYGARCHIHCHRLARVHLLDVGVTFQVLDVSGGKTLKPESPKPNRTRAGTAQPRDMLGNCRPCCFVIIWSKSQACPFIQPGKEHTLTPEASIEQGAPRHDVKLELEVLSDWWAIRDDEACIGDVLVG